MKVIEGGVYIHKWRGKKTHYKLEKGQKIKKGDLPKRLIESLINSKKIEMEDKENGE